jgi:nitroimidazol reductase NimA-like FMN-containing flavoprotein (pyridoxamine 5'-phosphate oxidase superfamily)
MRRNEIEMSEPEQADFLSDQRVVICATNGIRGWPHLMPLWYTVRDGHIWCWTYAKSQKTRNLERDPRATLQAEAGDRYDDLRGVMIQAETVLHHDLDVVTDPGRELAIR